MNRWITSIVSTMSLWLLAGVALAPTPDAVGRAGILQDAEGAAERTTWFFYRVKWGHQGEFLDLYQKNHHPILKAQLGDRLTDIKTYVPTYHGDGRADWTFAVALTFRDVEAMTGPSGEAAIARRLYPDQERFHLEEGRRFEILDAHWDVPLTEVNLDTRQPASR